MKANNERTQVVCPLCGQRNCDADADGAVEGPREYHAHCWHQIAALAEALSVEREHVAVVLSQARSDGRARGTAPYCEELDALPQVDGYEVELTGDSDTDADGYDSMDWRAVRL